MKNLLFITLLILVSCDSFYKCTIENKRNRDIYIHIKPSPKKYYDIEHYNGVIDTSKNDSNLYIKLQPKQNFTFYGSIGKKPTINSFPFKYLVIIYNQDTLKIKNKAHIINLLKRDKDTRNYILEIDSAIFNNI